MKRLVLATITAAALALVASPESQGQCEVPKDWFPHASTPPPDFHGPQSNCEFEQWAWQTFLWLTQETGDSRIRLLDFPQAEELFMPGKRPDELGTQTLARMHHQSLLLTPRDLKTKTEAATSISDALQAMSGGVLVDRSGHSVYYAIHVDKTYYDFVRDNQLYQRDVYAAAPDDKVFPDKCLELKSSWKILSAGETGDGFFTTKAVVHPLMCSSGAAICSDEEGVKIDLTRVEEVRVALVGLHVVGRLSGHPEFVWATFEHVDNAPDLPDGVAPRSTDSVSDRDWTFYKSKTAAKDCNVQGVKLDTTKGRLDPATQLFRQFALGTDATNPQSVDNAKDIAKLNESVRGHLTAESSVWKNYFLVGAVWFQPGAKLEPGLKSTQILTRTTGSTKLSNATMESFTQQSHVSCFACHNTAADGVHGLRAKNLNLSHVLKDRLIQRDELLKGPSMQVRSLRADEPSPPLASYADVKALFNAFIKGNNIPITLAPHKDFWNTMSYQEFITGNFPRVVNPDTGKPLPVLIAKDSKKSNLIMALRGTVGTIFDPNTGSIGRMPVSGPFMEAADIDRIADWIDRGCPN